MPKHNTTWELCTPKDKESNKTSTRNLDSKTAKTGREKVSDSKCNLVKIENLYRNYFTQVLLTGAEQIQDSHVLQQDRV